MVIHKTILKELFYNLVVIIFSLSVILFMEKFVRITRLFMGKGADLIDVAKIFIYLQPSILLLSIPMALLIAIFLTYGRMGTDSEIIVLKASGMSFPYISKAGLILSFLCFILLLSVSVYVLPKSMYAFRHTLQETIAKKASMTLEAGTFSDVFKGTVIYVKEMHSKDQFSGIFIHREADKSVNKPLVIVADKGFISSNPEEGLIKLSMQNGLIHTYNDGTSSEISFSEYDFILSSGIETLKKVKPEEMNTFELWKGRTSNNLWAVEFHRRLVLPFACLIFGLLGPSLSNRTSKIGRLGGFSFSLAILIAYYILLVLGESLSESGKITPYLGMWAPNMVFGVISVMFFYIAYRDKPLRKF